MYLSFVSYLPYFILPLVNTAICATNAIISYINGITIIF